MINLLSMVLWVGRRSLAAAAFLLLCVVVQASEYEEEVVVIGSEQSRQSIAGSATILGEESLAALGLTDLNQLLLQVPGVYIREEDGFGLRPNIGIRGATSERSQKITLMEDGILITPAPYSAPAAYYIPSAAKVVAVEVLKGPSAIGYGPHTVGGAINLLTRDSDGREPLLVDVELCSNAGYKVSTSLARKIGRTSFSGEILSYGSSGFKDLDGGGDTGFGRQDYDFKLKHEWAGNWRQRTLIKIGLAKETSDETYLGLSDTDFNDHALRRYAASKGDRFESEHTKVQLIHRLEPTPNLNVTVKAYDHGFDRSWLKLDGFMSGPSMVQVLQQPDN